MLTRALLVVVLAFYFLAGQVSADTGVVQVRAIVGGAITVSIDGTAAYLGNTPQPETTNPNYTNIVLPLQGSGGNQSSHSQWTADGNGATLRVRSNLPWTRVIPVEENSDTASTVSLACAG